MLYEYGKFGWRLPLIIIHIIFLRRKEMTTRYVTGHKPVPVWATDVLQGQVEEMIEHRKECRHKCPHTFGRPTRLAIYQAQYELRFVMRLIKKQARKA